MKNMQYGQNIYWFKEKRHKEHTELEAQRKRREQQLLASLSIFESEEGKKAFAEWMEKKNVLQNESFATQSKKDGE